MLSLYQACIITRTGNLAERSKKFLAEMSVKLPACQLLQSAV